MNHMEALKTAKEQSKKANEELAKIVKSNTTQLERDLNNQTKNALRDFRKNLISSLQSAYKSHTEDLKWRDLMIFILFILSLGALVTTIVLNMKQSNSIKANPSALTDYQTMTYQGETYALVPAKAVLKTKDGQYRIKVK